MAYNVNDLTVIRQVASAWVDARNAKVLEVKDAIRTFHNEGWLIGTVTCKILGELSFVVNVVSTFDRIDRGSLDDRSEEEACWERAKIHLEYQCVNDLVVESL